jgi:hypothetical protein
VGVKVRALWRPVEWRAEAGVDLSGRRVSGRLSGSLHRARPRVGKQRQIPPWAIGAEESLTVTIVTTNRAESPTCPGSGTFFDIVNDLVLDQLAYVCAICGASVPNFESASVHRRAVPMVRSNPAGVANPTSGTANRV